ncbi:MAG TPA: peptidoglycan DD-metalloendopeptidase family protein [Nitrospirota bacterium]|nr:peptidoglycan DD-metalloendopeptidase family protein [Nitrospirota bacterium]
MTATRSFMAAGLAALVLIACVSGAAGAESVIDKKKELQRIKREMEEKKRRIRTAGKRERSVLGELEKIDRAVQSRNAELARGERRLRDTEASLAEVEVGAAVVEKDLARIKDLYRSRVRAFYRMGRSGYAVGIFTSGNMSSAVKRMKYLEIVAEHDRRVIEEYQKTLSTYSQRQAEIAEHRAEIALQREEIRGYQKALAAQRQKKADLLSRVRKEKELYEAVYTELEESSEDLWTLIKREEEEKRKAAQARRTALPPPAASAPGRGGLPWPVHGKIVTPYGKQRHPQFGTVVFRRGIEIEVREGEQVRAVSSGRVIFADWVKGYGKLLILDHGTAFYTLYGYLSRLDVQKGASIAGGQVIGLAGETGSMKGSKLYFEIRRHGETEDPLAWLAPERTARR